MLPVNAGIGKMNGQYSQRAREPRWKILIADDCPQECCLVEACLKEMPEATLVGIVSDGEEAMAYIDGVGRFADRARFPYPNLLLLDYCMPVCDGIQVLMALKTRPERPRIILWSNTLLDIDRELASRLGANMVCKKASGPIEMRRIFSRLEAKRGASQQLSTAWDDFSLGDELENEAGCCALEVPPTPTRSRPRLDSHSPGRRA